MRKLIRSLEKCLRIKKKMSMLGGLVILAVIFRLSAHFSKICLPIFEIDLDVLNPWYEGKNDYIFLLKIFVPGKL